MTTQRTIKARLRRGKRRVRRYAARRQAERASVVINVAIERCLNLGPAAFPGGRDSPDPLTRTLVEYAADNCSAYQGSPVEAYYAAWCPATRAEVVGIDPAEASAFLREASRGNIPPLPWGLSKKGTSAAERLRRDDFRRAARRAGVDPEQLEGSFLYGPVSEALGELTFTQLVALYRSIERNGYHAGRPRRPHMGGRLMLRGDDYRVLIGSGKHRLAALSALGFTTVPVRIGVKQPTVIDPDDVTSWRHVANGNYTRDQALNVFHRMFDGRQPMR